MSLDEATTTKWSTENVHAGATDDNDGTTNTAKVLASPSYTTTKYPAFAWCAAKNSPAIAGINWYLPAIKELRQLYAAMSGLKWVASGAGAGEIDDWGNNVMPNDTYAAARTAFNGKFTSANGTPMDLTTTPYYWSSTENTVNDAWNVKFSNGNTNNSNKNFNLSSIRVVSAF